MRAIVFYSTGSYRENTENFMQRWVINCTYFKTDTWLTFRNHYCREKPPIEIWAVWNNANFFFCAFCSYNLFKITMLLYWTVFKPPKSPNIQIFHQKYIPLSFVNTFCMTINFLRIAGTPVTYCSKAAQPLIVFQEIIFFSLFSFFEIFNHE